MIQEFVDRFMENREQLKEKFREKHPEDYAEIVKYVIESISDDDGYADPDADRIRTIDDGEYQGTLLFVIAAKGYQPRDYWVVFVDYGSCSGCDTLQNISEYSSEPPTEEQVSEYMTLALHIVQGIKSIS